MDVYGDQHYINKDGMKCIRHYCLMKRFSPSNGGSGSAVILMDRLDAQAAIGMLEDAGKRADIRDDVFLLEDN